MKYSSSRKLTDYHAKSASQNSKTTENNYCWLEGYWTKAIHIPQLICLHPSPLLTSET